MIDLKAKPFHLKDEDISWVEQTLCEMSLQEKVGQLFCPIGLSSEEEHLQELLDNVKPGGIMFRPAPADEAIDVHRYLQTNSKIPMLIAGNVESGSNGAVLEGTEFGPQMQVAATADVTMAHKLGEVVADEGMAIGCNWAFAPVIDIDYNPDNPMTNVRTYGSNPELVGAMGKAYVKTVQSRGMAASAKHFPGDGLDYRDQHLVLAYNTLATEEWDKSYGHAYQECIDAGVMTIMAGHIALPEYTRKFKPGTANKDAMPATLAPELLNGLLRQQLGFNGLITTDATNMIGFTSSMKREEAVPRAIASGCDMFLFNKCLIEDFGFMMKGIQNGLLSVERVDQAVTRILATKAALKLHKINPNDALDISRVGHAENFEKSRECADKSITLVKDTLNLLPLSLDKQKKIKMIYVGDKTDMFGFPTPTYETLRSKLIAEGFEVDVYDTSVFNMRDMMLSVEEFVA